jgi:hypothetical protein
MIHRKDRVASRLAIITLLQDHHEKFCTPIWAHASDSGVVSGGGCDMLLHDLAWGFAETTDGFQTCLNWKEKTKEGKR